MMKPIKLDVDALAVETFATEDDGPRARGTVHAHLPTYEPGQETCASCDPRLYSICDPCEPETYDCPFTDPRFDPGCG